MAVPALRASLLFVASAWSHRCPLLRLVPYVSRAQKRYRHRTVFHLRRHSRVRIALDRLLLLKLSASPALCGWRLGPAKLRRASESPPSLGRQEFRAVAASWHVGYTQSCMKGPLKQLTRLDGLLLRFPATCCKTREACGISSHGARMPQRRRWAVHARHV